MKFCVKAVLQFDTPAKRDQMSQAIMDKIAGKITWGMITISQGLDEDGKPDNVVLVRFENEADMNELFTLIKTKMEQLPVLHGKVGKHLCEHDEALVHPPCVNSEEFVK